MGLCKGGREGGIKPIVEVEVRNEDKLLYILLPAKNNGLYGSTNSFPITCSINNLFLSLFVGKPFSMMPEMGL
jgi:hypothetical protein